MCDFLLDLKDIDLLFINLEDLSNGDKKYSNDISTGQCIYVYNFISKVSNGGILTDFGISLNSELIFISDAIKTINKEFIMSVKYFDNDILVLLRNSSIYSKNSSNYLKLEKFDFDKYYDYLVENL
jgi:hypothetical protein